MKASDILAAIQALDAARSALRTGLESVQEQFRIAGDCSCASAALRLALERECPELKISDGAK